MFTDPKYMINQGTSYNQEGKPGMKDIGIRFFCIFHQHNGLAYLMGNSK